MFCKKRYKCKVESELVSIYRSRIRDMMFLIIRIIVITILVISAFYINDGFLNLLCHTFIKLLVCIFSIYGWMLSIEQEKKVWSWIFGILAIMYSIYAYKYIHFSSLDPPDYFYLLTASLLIITIFTVKDEENELKKYIVINKAFYLFIILFITLTFSLAGFNYRWEKIDVLNFSINDHCYVVCNDFDSHCNDLRDCGWKYYRDRLTGLTKAVQDDYDLIIYEEETKLTVIGYIIDIGLFIVTALTVLSLYYYPNSKQKNHE